MRWRSPLPKEGRGFAPWVHALKGECGVYAIRDAETHEVLYVGESHSRRLLPTMTRHLYQWHGRGSGPSYQAERVEVAVKVLSAGQAIAEQYEWIARLRPRDNQVDGHSLYVDDELEEVPF